MVKRAHNRLTPTVCHVLHSLHFGGAEVLARRFAVGLRAEFRPVFACLDDLGPLGESLQRDGVPVCVLDRRPGFDIRCVWRLSAWLNQYKVTLIHAHQYAPFFYSSLARFKSRHIPVLFTEHGRDYPDYRRWKRLWVNPMLLRRRDHIVAVGEHVRQALIDNEGLPAARIEVIHNGVDPAPFELPASTRAIARTELGYVDDDFVIIQVARLNRLKDHGTAIRALAKLHESNCNVRLLLVGDGEERQTLETLVEFLKLRNVVQFVGSRSDVPKLLKAADVFLLTSISEGIPLTIVEAMLAGVPVVSTRVGGVPEVVKHQETGLLSTPGDPSSVAEAMQRIIDEDNLRTRLIQGGLRQAHEKLSDEVMLKKYQAAYHTLVTRSARACKVRDRAMHDRHLQGKAKGASELAAKTGT